MSKFTKTEEKILTVLWDADRPLLVSEICEHGLSINIKLKQSTVQVTASKLLDEGILKIGYKTLVGKTPARAFEPTITADEYAMEKFKEINKSGSMKITKFISALLQNQDVSKEELDELASIVEEMKNR